MCGHALFLAACNDAGDSGTGPIPFPYGRYPDPLPGLRLVFPSPPPVPVEASVVLGALPPPPISGSFGGWAHVDILSIPTNSFVTVAFDGEEIHDGPGPDLWTVNDGESLSQVLLEDTQFGEWIQKSVSSWGFRGVPLSYQEARIYHWHQFADRLIGADRIPPELRVAQVIGSEWIHPNDPRLACLD